MESIRHAVHRPAGYDTSRWELYIGGQEWGVNHECGGEELYLYVRVDVLFNPDFLTDRFNGWNENSFLYWGASLWLASGQENPQDEVFDFVQLGIGRDHKNFIIPRSLSVGDVVILNSTPSRTPMYLRCEPSGWSPIPDFSVIKSVTV